VADRVPRPRKQASDSQRPRYSGAIDQGLQRQGATYDERGRVLDTAIRSVKQQHDKNWQRTRERAEECRTLMAGDMPLVMPENFKIANADAFAADLPTTYTRPAELLALLLQKRCVLMRYRTTGSERSNDTATRLEQILTAVMEDPRPDHGYPWFQTCDVVQNDALACVITQPMPTFWEQATDWKDPETGTFRPEYQRDRDGKRRREVDKGFRANGKQSKRAYQDALDDWTANNVPIMYRAFGPQEITPIFGPNFRVDGCIVAGRYQRTSEMAMRFLWSDDGKTMTDAHLSPSGTEEGAGTGAYGEVEILEYWGYCWDEKLKKRIPYVSYCVDGAMTTWRDSGEPAWIDLSPYCSRLPVSIKWGQHWPGASNLDQRALPFMRPFLRWAGFPTYVVDRSASAMPVNPNAQPRTLDIEPLKVIEVDGAVTRLQGGDVSKDATMMLQMLLGENEKAAPPSQAAGKGESSGFEKTIARAYAEDAQFMILEGIRQLYEESASFSLEILTNIAREKKRPVLVYYAGPVVSPAEGDRVTSTQVMLELTPEMAGDQWRLVAKYPPSMSIAERQQSAELVERRLKTRYKHFSDDGDPAPERTVAEIEAEDLKASPIGQEQRWAMIAKILGDDQLAEKVRLMRDQRLSQGADGQGGLPFALAEGFEDILARKAAAEAAAAGGAMMPMPGPMGGGMVGAPGVALGVPDGGQMTGMGGGSSANGQLGAIVGAQQQAGPIATAEAAGGAVPAGLNSSMMGG
jgi:hypothetical protein